MNYLYVQLTNTYETISAVDILQFLNCSKHVTYNCFYLKQSLKKKTSTYFIGKIL